MPFGTYFIQLSNRFGVHENTYTPILHKSVFMMPLTAHLFANGILAGSSYKVQHTKSLLSIYTVVV